MTRETYGLTFSEAVDVILADGLEELDDLLVTTEAFLSGRRTRLDMNTWRLFNNPTMIGGNINEGYNYSGIPIRFVP